MALLSRRLHALVVAALTVLGFLVVATAQAPAADASASTAASLAAANVGKSAGYCAVNPTSNSLGGSQFETSCDGHLGTAKGEYWCADFVKWAWRHAGFNVSGLTAAALSFDTYGADHDTYEQTPHLGDAIVFGGDGHHVGIVTAVNSDGSVETENGDFGGVGGYGESYFARTSKVEHVHISARSQWVGSAPAGFSGMSILAIVAPSGSGGSSVPTSSGNPYSPSGLCGSGYGVIDSHDLGAARIFLLYNDGNGDNCVVTLADTDNGAVTMNATLAVQGGSSGSDPGSYHWYAGPVREQAPNSCVKWGGTYRSSSWTSGWEHCGAGSGSPAPSVVNPYSATDVCGSGYSVIDRHALTGAYIYLLYNDATGDNCVTTLATDATAAVTMKATLTVAGGTTHSDSGTYTYYAGPVKAYAPNSCVKWGGTYRASSWTSDWGHCGSTATPNPYTASGICGSGYSVIDSHDLGAAKIYLLYKATAGYNCVVTLADSGSGAVSMNATLSVSGGGSGSNPGMFTYYAGPIRLYAASACVKWGGSYRSTSWTSAWSHCG